jgi:hypothetical protein
LYNITESRRGSVRFRARYLNFTFRDFEVRQDPLRPRKRARIRINRPHTDATHLDRKGQAKACPF